MVRRVGRTGLVAVRRGRGPGSARRMVPRDGGLPARASGVGDASSHLRHSPSPPRATTTAYIAPVISEAELDRWLDVAAVVRVVRDRAGAGRRCASSTMAPDSGREAALRLDHIGPRDGAAVGMASAYTAGGAISPCRRGGAAGGTPPGAGEGLWRSRGCAKRAHAGASSLLLPHPPRMEPSSTRPWASRSCRCRPTAGSMCRCAAQRSWKIRTRKLTCVSYPAPHGRDRAEPARGLP